MRASKRVQRTGAAALEAAVVLPVFFLMVFGMFDLSIALLRNELLSEAARHGARKAMVHGQYAETAGRTAWAAVSTYANDTSAPIVQEVAPLLVGFNLAKTQVKLEWVDGSKAVQKQVRVTISAPYTPIMTSLFGSAVLTLSASSTMPIAF